MKGRERENRGEWNLGGVCIIGLRGIDSPAPKKLYCHSLANCRLVPKLNR